MQAGKRFTITNGGKAIADLVPSEGQTAKDLELAPRNGPNSHS